MDNIASQIVKRGMRKIVFQSKKKEDIIINTKIE